MFPQCHYRHKDQRKCVPRAQVCQLQPAAAEGSAGRTKQLSGVVPGQWEGGDAHDPPGAEGDKGVGTQR